ncbi:DNA polymerase lambda [Amanita rubescens]|nr:DNA polymerase lambda [Amanita rubescens]
MGRMTYESTAPTPGNKPVYPDSEYMVVANSSPSHIHSIVSEVSNSRDREVRFGSPLDRPDDGVLLSNHNAPLPLISRAEGHQRSGHTGEAKDIAQVSELASRAPGEEDDPSTSSIEDVSKSAKPLPLSTKKQMKHVQKVAHSNWNSESRGQAARRAADRTKKLTKLRHRIEDPQVTSEVLSKNENSSDESSIIEDTSPSPPPQTVAPSGISVTRESAAQEAKVTKKRVKDKKVKETINQVSPEHFAKMLMNSTQPAAYGAARRRCAQFLAGKNIFYTGGDKRFATERTRQRMKIIVRYGGNLIPKFDPTVVTHIVTDAQVHPTIRALGLKTLDDIPDHIPTVKWGWIDVSAAQGTSEIKLDEVWLHAAFSKRINAGISRAIAPPSGSKTKDKTLDISNISEFTLDEIMNGGEEAEEIVEDPTPSLVQHDVINQRHATSSKVTLDVRTGTANADDPLEKFYAKARAARESEWSRHSGKDDTGLESDYSDEVTDIPLQKKGWTCDKPKQHSQPCPNQDIIDKLQELMELHRSKPGDEDRWRVFSYSKCIRALRSYPRRIRTFNEARSIRGIGEKTALKIMEIIETGELRRIEYEKTDDVEVTRLFQGVYGAGQATAFKWYAAGCRTLEDLTAGKGGVQLSSVQEIGVKFYDDINSRMPRNEAQAIFSLIMPMALRLDPNLFVEIMGSFRRGKADCGDIDILITRPTDDGKTHAGVLPHLLRDLHAAKILTEDLALPEDPNDLEAIYRGLCRLPREGARRRRIDFLTVPWQSRGAALLYYTFNRAMRLKARVMGYSLNQRGLFSGVVRDTHDARVKTNPGQLIASETEEEIFEILGVPWQEPHERVRG